ncbi:MAG TPA: hypothetical protein VHT27_07670 [Solirubrobacteraceae bacterium]|jgi:hypothetical protein|nr:hypothetical protein [Solirubrobacteraceae bacterium]
MTEPRRARAGARARPLPGLGLAALDSRAAGLAQRWAVALVLDRPPEAIGEVPLERIAADGPGLVASVLQAVESDAALRALLGEDGDAIGGPAALLGDEPGAVIRGVEALRGVLWEALSAELLGSPAEALAAACDRLALVCALLAEHGIAGAGSREAGAGSERLLEVALAGPTADPVRIIDERDGHGRAQSRPAAPAARAEIAVHDHRAQRDPAAWIDSIGTALARFEQDGRPFAVLLVQAAEPRAPIVEEGRTITQSRTGEIEALLAGVLRAVAGPDARTAQAVGSLTRERAGRYWLLAPGLDSVGAQALAERLTSGAAAAARARGWSLEVAVGTAACPQDGREAAALAAHADVGLYAARAAARAAGAGPPEQR